jgi:hypothetical protein
VFILVNCTGSLTLPSRGLLSPQNERAYNARNKHQNWRLCDYMVSIKIRPTKPDLDVGGYKQFKRLEFILFANRVRARQYVGHVNCYAERRHRKLKNDITEEA